MKFLAMLIALALHQLVQPGPRAGDAQLLAWEHWLSGRIASPELRALVAVLAPLTLLYWVLAVLQGWLFGLPTLLAWATLLLWSMGREDYHTATERFAALRDAGDDEGAWLCAQSVWSPQPLPAESATAAEAIEHCEQRLLYCGFQRWFAPLFWFLLFGPLAAVAYRSVQLLAVARDGRMRAALGWLDWAPARLLALSFAITGDFVAVARSARFPRREPAPALLRRAALASSGNVLSARTLRDLLYRTAGLWLLVAALLIIVL